MVSKILSSYEEGWSIASRAPGVNFVESIFIRNKYCLGCKSTRFPGP